MVVYPEKFQLLIEWVLTATQRELAVEKNHTTEKVLWGRATLKHEELSMGAQVLVQLQRGPTKGRWYCSSVVEMEEHNFYLVRMDGSRSVKKEAKGLFKHI